MRENEKDAAIVAGIITGPFVFALAIAIVVFQTIMRGFVLSVLWGWFIVPVFGLPSLHISPAIGISLVAGIIGSHSTRYVKDENPGTSTLMWLSQYPLTLLVGYVVHLFM